MIKWAYRWLVMVALITTVLVKLSAQDDSYTTTDTSVTVNTDESDTTYYDENAHSQNDYDYMQEKGFQRIYEGSTLVDSNYNTAQRSIDKGTLDKWKKDDDFNYVKPEEKKPEENQAARKSLTFLEKIIEALSDLFSSTSFKVVMWIAIIIGFLLVVSWLVGFDLRILIGRKTAVQTQRPDTGAEESLMHSDLQKALSVAMQSGDYKMAIRIMYLMVLKNLADKNIIAFRDEKTNNEYVRELYGTKYYNDFFQLTRVFEYTSYGHFDVSEEMFGQVQQGFNNFNKTV